MPLADRSYLRTGEHQPTLIFFNEFVIKRSAWIHRKGRHNFAIIDSIRLNLNRPMETSQKTFSPFLLVGGVVTLVLILLVMRGNDSATSGAVIEKSMQESANDETPAPLPVEQPAVTHDAYQAAVIAIMTQYNTTGDAGMMQQALLAMRVPSEDRSTHEALVILLGKAEAGDKEEAAARYAELKTTVTWLP